MTESVSTSVAKAIERSLASIRKSAGYLTDCGQSVHRGWYAHAIDAQDVMFPLVAIQPDTEAVASVGGTGFSLKITDNYRIVVITDDAEHPADVLKDCLADIRRAFALNWDAEKKLILGVRAPEFGVAEFAIAADSPHTLAAVPVGISFNEKHEA